MADLLLILALAAWFTLWFLRDTGHTQVRRGTGLRWARRRATPPSASHPPHTGHSPWPPPTRYGSHHAGHGSDALHPGGDPP
jgi:hypothetical protein